MAQLSYQEFIDYVKEFIVSNEKAIANMWPQKGGWEGWAQSSIFSFILGKNSTYDILRERHVYTSPAKAADFLLNNSSPVGDRVIIELKCQSLENCSSFKKGLDDDIRKLARELDSSYSGATLLVIGIYFSEHLDIPGSFDKEILGTGEVGICWAVDQNS